MTLTSFRSVRSILILCCLGSALADWLFYSQPSGGNFFVFHFFLLLLAALQVPAIYKRHTMILLFSLMGLLLAMVAQPGPLVLWLFWLGILGYVFTARQGWSSNTVEWVARWLHFGVTFLFASLRDLWVLKRWRSSGHGANSFARFWREFVKWLFPAAGSILFLALFTVANPVLSYWIQRWETSVANLLNSLAVGPDRVFFWLFIASILWAFCRMRYKRRHFPLLGAGKALSASVLVRCLGLFNAVFALQTVLDCVYLWGGATLPAGMTYAEYAHRGAYPLIATALLAGAFVLATTRAGLPTHETTIVRRLVILWLGQNVLLTFNSLWRLHLYVEVYSLTRLRFAAAIWMLLVSAGILLIIWRIYSGKSNAWLLNANFVTLALVLYICCFVNFDGIISRYNVEHSKEVSGKGVCLDIRYLEQIGAEAIPALVWFQQNSHNVCKAEEAQLAAIRLIRNLNDEWGNWRSRTIRKYALRKEAAQIDINTIASQSIHPGSGATAKSMRHAGLPVL